VSDDPNPALAEWSVRPSVFRRQMQWLHHHGYQPVTLANLIDAFVRGKPLDKAIVITFDDGYLDTVTTAAPILAEFGFPATVFVVPALVGKTAQWDAEFGGDMAPLATWEQVRALSDQGWEIGLHSHSHHDLTALPLNDVIQDLTEGRRILENALDREVTSFAYPYGEFSAEVASAVADAGFHVAVTLGSRLATPGAPRFALERVPVMRNTNMASFRLMVKTGLDLRGLLGFGFGMPIRVVRELLSPVTPG
jgi:peptidoglycan/xylan/chitin deacetylase (PgdA/CDA1 family)